MFTFLSAILYRNIVQLYSSVGNLYFEKKKIYEQSIKQFIIVIPDMEMFNYCFMHDVMKITLWEP